LTAVNLDELLGEKINTDQAKMVALKEVRTFLHVKILKQKRNNDNNNQDVNELSIKILRAMLTLAAFFTDKEDPVTRPDILTPATYAEAVGDPT